MEMNENRKDQTTLVDAYAQKWPSALAYILLAMLVSLGFQLIAAKFQFIANVDHRSVLSSVCGVMVVVAAAWIQRILNKDR